MTYPLFQVSEEVQMAVVIFSAVAVLLTETKSLMAANFFFFNIC